MKRHVLVLGVIDDFGDGLYLSRQRASLYLARCRNRTGSLEVAKQHQCAALRLAQSLSQVGQGQGNCRALLALNPPVHLPCQGRTQVTDGCPDLEDLGVGLWQDQLPASTGPHVVDLV